MSILNIFLAFTVCILSIYIYEESTKSIWDEFIQQPHHWIEHGDIECGAYHVHDRIYFKLCRRM